jgi:hypothetical protein
MDQLRPSFDALMILDVCHGWWRATTRPGSAKLDHHATGGHARENTRRRKCGPQEPQESCGCLGFTTTLLRIRGVTSYRVGGRVGLEGYRIISILSNTFAFSRQIRVSRKSPTRLEQLWQCSFEGIATAPHNAKIVFRISTVNTRRGWIAHLGLMAAGMR